MGNAAFLTASFAIIAKEFPNNVATTFASLETFFGLGLIVGPTVGGALYQVFFLIFLTLMRPLHILGTQIMHYLQIQMRNKIIIYFFIYTNWST